MRSRYSNGIKGFANKKNCSIGIETDSRMPPETIQAAVGVYVCKFILQSYTDRKSSGVATLSLIAYIVTRSALSVLVLDLRRVWRDICQTVPSPRRFPA
ncbi:MAG: hypothetical protein IPK61_09645 [Saprospiraceae bacterium]|nr:hypothetical protein [Saprospiraceae bacterium]